MKKMQYSYLDFSRAADTLSRGKMNSKAGKELAKSKRNR